VRALHHAIGPAQFHHELAAMLKLGEPDYCVSEGVGACHNSSMPDLAWYVKYIVAQVSGGSQAD
jgi:hypothetical protein